MFRAFVDEDAPRSAVPQNTSSGGRPLLIVGVVVVIVVIAAVAWLALK